MGHVHSGEFATTLAKFSKQSMQKGNAFGLSYGVLENKWCCDLSECDTLYSITILANHKCL